MIVAFEVYEPVDKKVRQIFVCPHVPRARMRGDFRHAEDDLARRARERKGEYVGGRVDAAMRPVKRAHRGAGDRGDRQLKTPSEDGVFVCGYGCGREHGLAAGTAHDLLDQPKALHFGGLFLLDDAADG